MNYRNPKKINRNLGVIGFGAWQLGNTEFFGEMDDHTAINLVDEAVKKGVTVFDTAPGYGNGNSERLLGIALKPYRKDVFINTKFGHTPEGHTDFSVDGLYRSVEGSLSRLQTAYLDSVILHNPGRELLYQTAPIYTALQELKATGVIRHYGVSIDTVSELETVLTHNTVDVIELMFNIIHQSPKALFEEVQKQGIMLMIKVPLDSGWLTGKYTKDTRFTGIRARWTNDVITKRLEIIAKIQTLFQKQDITHESLQFILHFSAVTCVIPGVRTVAQLQSNVEAQAGTLTIPQIQELETLYDTYIKNQDTPW